MIHRFFTPEDHFNQGDEVGESNECYLLTSSFGGLGKDKLGLFVKDCVCDKNQSFTNRPSVETMTHWENRGLWI